MIDLRAIAPSFIGGDLSEAISYHKWRQSWCMRRQHVPFSI